MYELSCVDTPQQNAIVERNHQQILNVARVLKLQSQIPLSYWGDCILAVVYLINRTPSKLLHNKTPYEMLFNKPPSFTHLRCFGCLCFISTLTHNRHKFASRARRCVFLGYPHSIKVYKVLDLDSNSIRISRDIVFYEIVYPFAQIDSSMSSNLDNFDFPHIGYVSEFFHSSPSAYEPPNFTSSIIPSDSVPILDHSIPTSSDVVSPISDSHCSIDPSSPPFSLTSFLFPLKLFQLPLHQLLLFLGDQLDLTMHLHISQIILIRQWFPTCPGSPYDISDYLSYEKLGSSFHSFVMSVTAILVEPVYFHQVVKSTKWRATMDKEIAALEKNNTWTLTRLPFRKIPIGRKWVYRIKYNPNGTIERYKARLVAKRYTQKKGLNYSETFSPMTKSISVRMVLALVAMKGWFLHQMDVNNAFLHGDLIEEVYMSLPLGFHSKGENLVCKLNKSLYGLKQASR